jgi:hypothetical protein
VISGPVLRWLLDSDPSIRWQVMRDLTGAPAAEVAAERARVTTEGVGARLEVRYPGDMPVEIDEGEGRPSRWNTLRALRVLRWYANGIDS